MVCSISPGDWRKWLRGCGRDGGPDLCSFLSLKAKDLAGMLRIADSQLPKLRFWGTSFPVSTFKLCFWVLDVCLSEPQARLSTAHFSPSLSGHLLRWFHDHALLVLGTRANDYSLCQETQVQLLRKVEGGGPEFDGLSFPCFLFVSVLEMKCGGLNGI